MGRDGVLSQVRLDLEEDGAALAAEVVQGLQQSLGHLYIGQGRDRPFGRIGDGPWPQGSEEHLGAGSPLASILDGQASDLPAEYLLQVPPLARLQDVATGGCGHEGVPITFVYVAG